MKVWQNITCTTCWILGRAKSTSVQEEDDKTENDDWSDEDVSLPLNGADSRPKTAGSQAPTFYRPHLKDGGR